MTISEMIAMEKSFYYKKILYDENFFNSLNIEVVNNSPEELAAAILEINQRIDRVWNGPNYPLSDLLHNNIGRNSKAVLSTKFIEMNPDIVGNITPVE